MDNNAGQLIQNLYGIIGKKQVALEGAKGMTLILQAKVDELVKEIEVLEGKEDGDKSNKESG